MNPTIFPLLAAVLTTAPCMTLHLDCDAIPTPAYVVLEIRPCSAPTGGAPWEWTALPACPPSDVTWCPILSPPYAVTWNTYDQFFQRIDQGLVKRCP
jgi:hypothetical protein